MRKRRLTLARTFHLLALIQTYGRPQHDYYCSAVRGMESDCHCGLSELRAELKAMDLPAFPKRATQ